MPFTVPIDEARALYSDYEFVCALTPSAQKAAFHVRDSAGTDLCFKIIAPNNGKDRLDREVRALLKMDHPNVVKLREYTFSSTAGSERHYMIEDFVPGKDLEDELTATPWAPARARQFFGALFSGLAELQDQNLVHRDLKPTNIRVHTDGHPVIIDFGLARHLDLPDLTATAQGAGIGTPNYFAPEQFVGTKHDIDYRTDLFAAGVIMYRALIGRHPFAVPSMSFDELKVAVCESDAQFKDPQFLALPSAWQTLISRLLQKERVRRPVNARLVGVILAKLGDS